MLCALCRLNHCHTSWSNIGVTHTTLRGPARSSINIARGSDDNAFSGFSKAKKKLDEATGETGWRLHDLCRTVSTGMAHLKVQIEVVKKLLNPSSGTLGASPESTIGSLTWTRCGTL